VIAEDGTSIENGSILAEFIPGCWCQEPKRHVRDEGAPSLADVLRALRRDRLLLPGDEVHPRARAHTATALRARLRADRVPLFGCGACASGAAGTALLSVPPRFEGHTRNVNAVVDAPDGRHAVSGSCDRTVRVWKVPD